MKPIDTTSKRDTAPLDLCVLWEWVYDNDFVDRIVELLANGVNSAKAQKL